MTVATTAVNAVAHRRTSTPTPERRPPTQTSTPVRTATGPTSPTSRSSATRARRTATFTTMPASSIATATSSTGRHRSSPRVWVRSRPARTAGDVEYDGPMQDADQQDAAADLLVVKTGIGRVVDLDTSVLPILPIGEFYELWFVAPDDSPDQPNRVSAGTFHPDPDGRSNVRFAAAVDPTEYPSVEITAEPADGNPAATGPVVLHSDIG
ncbi:MAG: anti-sigma factor [Actinomycetota bacterium]|nr:anti-sigma factor [Actinomycetota bacterium]